MVRKTLSEEHEEKRRTERTTKDGKKRSSKDNFKNKV